MSASRFKPEINIRCATAADIPLILALIKELAEYERLTHQVTATAEQLHDQLFGSKPAAEVIIGEYQLRPIGFALYFPNFSTFLGKPGLYLEDLYVQPQARGKGMGAAMLRHLAKIAIERGCGRMEWAVLDWNQPAIDFYNRVGAVPLDDWTLYRLTGAALEQVASQRL